MSKKSGKKGTSSDDTLSGTNRADTISGRGGNDIISGNDGNDKIHGGKGNDTIYGGAGNDKIHGGKGNDLITSGAGADKLTGNSGNDHFIYLAASDSPAGSGWDRITDFTQGQDKIDLAALRGDTDLVWSADNVATEYGVWFTNSGKSTFVYADTDGNGIADLKIELEHTRGLNLTVDDFIGVSDAPPPPENSAPVASGDQVLTNLPLGATIVIPGLALLGNDTDAEGQPVVFGNVAADDVDDVAAIVNGNVHYTDNGAATGSFQYTVSDGVSQSAFATVTVETQAGNTVTGTDANEILIGNPDISNTLNGAGGTDTVSYAGVSGPLGVVVDLSGDLLFGFPGTYNSNNGAIDSLVPIENVIGSAFDDNLAGDGGANVLVGGAGNDLLIGGAGADVFKYSFTPAPAATSGDSFDTIVDFVWGTDKLEFNGLAGITLDQFNGLFKLAEANVGGEAAADTIFSLMDNSWSVTLFDESGHTLDDFYGTSLFS